MGVCTVCEGDASSFCTRCKKAYYCDAECYKCDAKNHKLVCRIPSKDIQITNAESSSASLSAETETKSLKYVSTRVALTKYGLSVNSNLICIRDSPVSGRGVFALCDIPAGTLIADEIAEVAFYNTSASIQQCILSMSPRTKKLLLQLRTDKLTSLEDVLRDSVCLVSADDFPQYSLSGNHMLDSSSCSAGMHYAFVLERFFNHCCGPTAHRAIHDGHCYITTYVDIPAGEEISLCYYHACYSLPKRERSDILPFTCKCSVCVGRDSNIERARRAFQKKAGILLNMNKIDVRMKCYNILTDMFDEIMETSVACLPHITTGPSVIVNNKSKQVNLNPLFCDTVIMCIAKLLESGLLGDDFRYTLKKLLDISIIITEFRHETHTDNYISHVILRSAMSRIS